MRICSEAEAEREIKEAERIGVRFIALGEAEYLAALQTIYDPPPLLAVRGRTSIFMDPIVSMVGARNASAIGIKFAEKLARDLGEAGFIVASGLARGIDAAAHRSTLTTGTIAVLAGGQARIYPREHEPLSAQIADVGALISEMPITWEPRAQDFPRRNRLISGLALGVVVVEAARRSGSLITARRALDQGREVFAVPGSPLDPRSEGTNALLKDGATLVTEAADVINALGSGIGRLGRAVMEEEEASDLSPLADLADRDRASITSLLGPSPVSIDDLVRLSGAAPAAVRTVLLELELAGRVVRHGAALVSLIS